MRCGPRQVKYGCRPNKFAKWMCQRRREHGSSWFLVNLSAHSLRTSPANLDRPERSSIVEKPLPQEAETCPAVHHSFDGFKLVDFPLGRPLAPGQAECLPSPHHSPA